MPTVACGTLTPHTHSGNRIYNYRLDIVTDLLQVLEWLQMMESRVNHLRPVAVDLDVIKNQQEELKPLSKEYRDYLVTMERVSLFKGILKHKLE